MEPTEPHDIPLIRGGVERTSMGKSSNTGPGAPDLAIRQAYETSRGISSTIVTLWQNFVTGFAKTTWSWNPWRQLVSASRRGAEDVTTKMGDRSANAVVRPGKPFAKLEGYRLA